jgi:peptide/nickel transport system ATP-binding protein
MPNILEIRGLTLAFQQGGRRHVAIEGVNLDIEAGKTLGIVGESGSGKSATALSIMRLLPSSTVIEAEGIFFRRPGSATATDLLSLKPEQMRRIRGGAIGMVFQEPMTSLNPVFRCGWQVVEALQIHRGLDSTAARLETLNLFEQVGLPDAERIFASYPHEISGGQKQRVMIAMALSCGPDLLIADEPTTALDVQVQKSLLDLFRQLQRERGLSMLFISHDLGVIAEICDKVAVMYRGCIVEMGDVTAVLEQPQHPYTRGLIACRPSLVERVKRLPTVADFLGGEAVGREPIDHKEVEARRQRLYQQKPLLEVRDVEVHYEHDRNWFGRPRSITKAVDRVSFDLFRGETLGIAGASGCGKTTLGRSLIRLEATKAGSMVFAGTPIQGLIESAFRPFRKNIQMVFQDPYASLNPRMRIGEAILEPMSVHGLHGNRSRRREKVVELLESVGLEAHHFERYPHEFSGGQRQRIGIARALAVSPQVIICDEIVSALDVSVQATILNLLTKLQSEFGLTYLFISHDLSVIHQMCDRVMIMNHGKVEVIDFPENLFHGSQNSIVRQLVDSIPGKVVE